jgi:Rrf2 family transcriptional regulator, nitric oxide-sensitive transcriptional repressor
LRRRLTWLCLLSCVDNRSASGASGRGAGNHIDNLILDGKIWISRSRYTYLRKKPQMFSQTTEYALRAVTHLAGQIAVEAPTTAQISQATHIPSNYLAKVLRNLSRAGLVHSQRGPGGGHKLARDPAKLTVLQVVNAVDRLTRIQSCPLGIEHHRELCPLHRRLDSAIAMVEEAFSKTTVAELVPSPTRKSAACRFPCVAVGNLISSEATPLRSE